MYVSIDIETTGLDPDTDQILEVAAVIDDRSRRVKDCPIFQTIVKHDRISGQPRALEMNADLIMAISGGIGQTPQQMCHGLGVFLRQHLSEERQASGDRYIALGKNFASFDWQFLTRVLNFPEHFFSYRMLDVGSLYAEEDGMKSLTALSEAVAEDFEIDGAPHQALYDARVALALARLKWGIEV